ncbi:MAG TPA: molybdenum cofactor guanylyltransferase [Anaerolineales bacterium]|nr:molybdenum cofactor guanylyltransferase [Anaerolineales bacterium]
MEHYAKANPWADSIRLTLALLSGGNSSRMGQDKALLSFLGRPLILRVIERLSPLAEEVLLSTNRPQEYAFLGLPAFPDLHPGDGPLGGLYTCLSAAKHPLVAAAACDMPFASPALFEYERDLLAKTGADAVIPSTPDGLEPLHAVYRRETCLPVVERALESGKLKLSSWLAEMNAEIILPETVSRIDPSGLAFWNLNTPDEFHQAEERAREE